MSLRDVIDEAFHADPEIGEAVRRDLMAVVERDPAARGIHLSKSIAGAASVGNAISGAACALAVFIRCCLHRINFSVQISRQVCIMRESRTA